MARRDAGRGQESPRVLKGVGARRRGDAETGQGPCGIGFLLARARCLVERLWRGPFDLRQQLAGE